MSLRLRCPAYDAIIGLAGGIGSGKSNVLHELSVLGAVCIDGDKLAHRVYLPGQGAFDKLVDAFGADIVASSGEIDRKRLGAKVFGNDAALKQLNSIVWPALPELIVEEFNARDAPASSPSTAPFRVGVLEAALLIEAGMDAVVDEVWCTVVSEDEAVSRIMERNGFTGS
jgi:dephospho-CoA kinase